VFNWFSFEVFDLSTTAHYAVNLMLQALLGFEIFRWVHTLTGRGVAAAVAASCFLLFPVALERPFGFRTDSIFWPRMHRSRLFAT
jgi:hypothetical protein